MIEYSNEIKNIIKEEFGKLLNIIEKDFYINFNKKRYNFLLEQLDNNIIANMVFVSSFESKSGFAIEACAKRIAMLKFGENNVPKIVNPHNLSHNINEDNINGQIIVTNINIDNSELSGKISEFRAQRTASGRGKNRIESQVNQETIKELLPIGQNYVDQNIYTKPVDLAFFDGKNWNLFELKAGGDLDSANAPSNVEKLLTIYTGLNIEYSKIYFGTLYNKNGEGNTWTGAVKKHMAFPEMFLIGSQFWNKILPGNITFENFCILYKEALNELNINKRINTMIQKALEGKND